MQFEDHQSADLQLSMQTQQTPSKHNNSCKVLHMAPAL